MAAKKDLTNQKFGRVTVIKEAGKYEKNGSYKWECQCDCGTIFIIIGYSLTKGKTISCGCYNKEKATKHNHNLKGKTSSTYYSWVSMKTRCYNPNHPSYDNYGGRGITVCDRWKDSFNNFLADMGERPKGMTIDRIDNNKNYEPSNCQWASNKQQHNNKRSNHLITYQDRTQTLTQWAEELNINRATLYSRINTHRWNVAKAFTTPVK
jgi:hypothetical protein